MTSLPLRTSAVIRFYENRIELLTLDEVGMLAKFVPKSKELVGHFKNYKKGVGEKRFQGDAQANHLRKTWQ